MRRHAAGALLIFACACGDDGATGDAGADAGELLDGSVDATSGDGSAADGGRDTGSTSDDGGLSYAPVGGLDFEFAALGDTTDEAGSLGFGVWIRLAANPGALVDCALFSEDEGEVIVTPPRLRFSTRDWETPQLVMVQGVDDSFVDGDVQTSLSLRSRSRRSPRRS